MACSTLPQAAVQMKRIVSPNSLSIDYESKEVKDNSEGQVLWSRIMDKGLYKNPSTYKKVEVLLLCWAKESDDIGPGDEVCRLKSVLEDQFHYHTQTELLDDTLDQRLQLQLNAKLASFVYAHDGTQTLLIVYYAGHGRPGAKQTSENDRRDNEKRKQNRVVWNQTEDLLRPAKADVLEIFDCCYAGTLGLTKGEDRRSFEFLAATKFDKGTPIPGDNSFTSALIYALKELVNETPEGRFTTVELLRKIKTHPHFPKEQQPVLSDRRVKDNSTPVGRIMLHPLQKKSSKATPYEKGDDLMSLGRQTLTLHFDFGKEVSPADIETLGIEMNTFTEHNASLLINGVRWGGLRQSILTRFVQTLKDRTSMRRKQADLRIGTSEEPCDTPGLLTPSSLSQRSPRETEPVTPSNAVGDPSRLSPASPSSQERGSTPRVKRQRVEMGLEA